MATNSLTKRALIDKTNTRMVVITSVAAFVVVFSLVATKTFIGQAAYQNRIITAKRQAVTQLKANIKATDDLKASYRAFVQAAQNKLGGNSLGAGPNDGNNADLILDALPSSYDFPALANSIESLLDASGVSIVNISGTDEEIAQGDVQASATPEPIAMPFQITVTGSYDNIKGVVDQLERSIRPFQIQTMQISGDESNLTMTLSAQTYYQPAKSLKITMVVKK